MPRITETAKQETRQRVIEEACKLFRDKSFEETTTREIAAAAGIATGTLFNYFPTKELIVMTLVEEGLAKAHVDFEKSHRGEASLDEDLFLHVSTGLRKLKKHRKYLRPVLETSLSPLAESASAGAGENVRIRHLEMVQQIVDSHLPDTSITAVTSQIYWTLYTGVLAFWSADSSPSQEDTLALLDQSVSMFVSSITNGDHHSN